VQGRLALLALAAGLLLAAAAPPPAGAARGGLIASSSACPGQTDVRAPAGRQLRAMRCMTNFARRKRGLAPLRQRRALNRAARRKSIDILRCDDFSHEACGRDSSHWFERFGYLRRCSLVGENIAWGSGPLGSVRSLFVAWMRSSGHRANILGRDYEHLGLGLRVGKLEGVRGAHVWAQAFGGSCS
jgi:uncharacterized protein YkwD